MKRILTFQLDDDLNWYLRDIAHKERLSIAEVLRRIIEDHRNNSKSITTEEEIDALDQRIEALREQQKQLTYQRDYLKDRIEDK